MHEKIFTHWGCLSFFVQSKTGEVSYWKRNVGSGVGTKTFWSGISGYEFLRVRSFCDFTNNYGFIEQHCHFVFFLLLLIKVLSIQEVFCKGRQFPYKVFCDDPVRHDFFPQYRDAPTLFLRMKIFDTRIFCDTERFPYNFFSALWGKKLFNREKWYLLLMHENVRYPKFSKTLEGSPRIFFALWDKR